MKEKNREETWSPLATIEDIERRLVRPSFLQSPSPTSAISSLNSCREDSRSSKKSEEKFKESKGDQVEKESKRKLEDYLDPILLAAVSSKINRAKKITETKAVKELKVDDFHWPVQELKVLLEDSSIVNTTVNHKDGLNLIGYNKDRHQECNTHFQRFEQVCLRRFKGSKNI